jgi:diguanylate cyclase (GGDEF)-like protein
MSKTTVPAAPTDPLSLRGFLAAPPAWDGPRRRPAAVAPPKHPSVLWTVVAFVALVSLFVVGLCARQIVDGRAADVRAAKLQTANLSGSLAQQVTDSFRGVEGVLLGIKERVETEGSGPRQLPRLQAVIDAEVATLPIIHNLFVVSANARGLVGLLRVKGVRYAQREWFVYHRTHADRSMHVGPPIRSRRDRAWLITVSRRVDNADGSFGGVVVASIQERYFQRLYERVNLGKRGSVTLFTADGSILVRKPFNSASIGKSLAKGAVFSQIRSHPARGSYQTRSIIDGVVRFFAYTRVEHYPLFIAVGTSEDETLAEWRWQTWINVAEAAFTMTLMLIMGNYFIRQIRRREAVEAELERLALVDPLTGLGNRRHFDAVLEREWRRAVRARSAFAFLMIDVDDFKSYNDQYGHRAGDRTLKTVAACIAAAATRPEDVAARYGGEEFAILLPMTDERGAYRIAETIRTAIAELRTTHAASPRGYVTVSIGVAVAHPGRGRAPGELVDAADRALYNAKRHGRNRSEVAPEPIPTAS